MIRFRAGILSGASDNRIPWDVGVSIPQPSARIYLRSQGLGISRGGKRRQEEMSLEGGTKRLAAGSHRTRVGTWSLARCYNPSVNSRKRLAQLKLEFLNRIQDCPHDISVPAYERWDGPGPIPMVDYVVEYEADAQSILRRVVSRDQGLGLMQQKLEFRLTEQAHVLVVSLSQAAELSAF
jgi:hypothetical protein